MSIKFAQQKAKRKSRIVTGRGRQGENIAKKNNSHPKIEKIKHFSPCDTFAFCF